MRQKRKKILNKINEIQKHQIAQEVESAVSEISKAKNDHQFFNAIKFIRAPKKNNRMIVHDKEGKSVADPNEQYKIVKQHFESQFFDIDKQKIDRFVGEPKPLNRKITAGEVKCATKRLKNNKAAGDDGIPPELFKYAPDLIQNEIAEILNKVIEKHDDQIDFGISVLLPTPKPKKEQGPAKHLRPLNLLPMIRKTLSMITLNRISGKVNKYLSQSQSAYREGKSTTDAIWAHRFIIAKTMLYKDQSINVTGLDISIRHNRQR